MSAKTEIRSLTYSELATQPEFSNNKWKPNNDDVFNKLGEMVKEKEKELISDFLNLFYYFIICYSKKCFKKNGLWQSSRYRLYNNRTKILGISVNKWARIYSYT